MSLKCPGNVDHIQIHHQVDTIQINLIPNDNPDSFIIENQKTGEQLGTLIQPSHASHTVELFVGKGGFMGVITSPLGAKYFALPGASVSVGETELVLDGEPLTANASRKTTPSKAIAPQSYSSQATILGAGLATRFERISGESTQYSKPAVPLIGNKSVIECIANSLANHGFNHLIVNTYFKAQSLKASLARCENSQVRYIDEAEPSGTAGGLRKMLFEKTFDSFLDQTRPLLVVQGDSVTDADYSALMEAHIANKALVTIGCQLVAEKDVDKFGIIVTDQSASDGQSGKIVAFQEKPKRHEAKSRLGNTGFYIFSPKAYPVIKDIYTSLLEDAQLKAKSEGKTIPSEVPIDFANDIFPVLLQLSQEQSEIGPFWAQIVEGYWSDIGNPTQYIETIHDLYTGKTTLPLPLEPDIYYQNGVIYWEGASVLAAQESAQLVGNVIVGLPFKEEN